MGSETRAVGAFAGLGVVFIVIALLLSHLEIGASGVDKLPPASPAPAAVAVAPSAPAVPAVSPPASGAPVKRLLQRPSLSRTQIAFDFAGEIWVVGRDGGEARRLVTGQLDNWRPIFSPDGATIAFTGTYDGNTDVYTVPAAGGEPTRLTYSPGSDAAVGWTPDGTRVLFNSMRETARDLPRLFTVSRQGGAPEALPLPSGADASYSPDGTHLAYVPHFRWQPGWKQYRGGQATPIWIADLSDSHIAKVPRVDSNDRRPMWVGDTLYFLSDRNLATDHRGTVTLFADDLKTGTVREVIHNPDGFEVRYASAGPGAIVYEQLGELHLYDLASGSTRLVPVTISADLPQLRARLEKIRPDHVLHAAVSPTGKRVLFEARGEILSVPAEKGDTRNLTRSPGVADRDPSWSPDGKWIAWLSDQSGEYALYFRAPDGLEPPKKIDLGDPPSFFYSPRWSPDSKKIMLTDKRLNLWLIDIDHPTPVKVDTQRFGSSFQATWAPDSRWIAYVKELENHLHAVFVYSLEDKKIHPITDGRSDVNSPEWDRGGKFLSLLVRTDYGLAAGDGGEMTRMGRPVTSSVYAAVLRKDLASPVAPESDEEGDLSVTGEKRDKGDKDKADKGDEADKGGKDHKGDKGEKGDKVPKKPVKPITIDFENIDQRIVALPIDRANYVGTLAGDKGVLFLIVAPIAFADEDYVEFDEHPPPLGVMRFDLKTRKTERFLEKIHGHGAFHVTADAKSVLYSDDDKWFIAPSDKPPKPGEGEVKLKDVEVWVDPRAEWRQIYHEVWRIERDFLYDPGFHGLDLAAAEKIYGQFLDGIASRDDLNDLMTEALSNLVLGHVWVDGGATPHQERVSVGLLGADYRVVDGRYQIARILRGENWNPKLRAPLTEPGVDVKEGDFVLAVNGQDVPGTDAIERAFLGTAGKQTVLTVAASADGRGARKVAVVPVGSESRLRLRTWMEESRKKVDELSGGRVGYVFIPDTQAEGFTNFNRYYFSQVSKEAVVLDERFNHGGQIADYIVNILKWTPVMGAMTREGEDITIPTQAIFGPKVMIANQMSGSGGDALPWLFKKAGIGPLVGVRTWGGLVGIGGYPRLMDGGMVTAPRWALYGTHGEWEVENHGIAPDVEVEQDPALVRQGHDPQLERAVQLALDALAKNPPQKLVRPRYPDYGNPLPKVAPVANRPN
jgi:tricorn protease